MDFKKTFKEFYQRRNSLKVIVVASSTRKGHPNAAPKMLVDIRKPNQLFFLDYKFTQTYENLKQNHWISVAFMDDRVFTGYRLNGTSQILRSGEDFKLAKRTWRKRAIFYEADRMVERIRGHESSHQAENMLPDDFVIVKLTAGEASIVKPDRVLRAIRQAG